MSDKILKKLVSGIWILLLFSCIVLPSQAQGEKTVRVGYPLFQGFSELKEDVYSGYTYDYLQEIARYTGWNYEFVSIEGESGNEVILKYLDMLEKGEIDLMGSMNYSEEAGELYDYAKQSYGSSYRVLCTLSDHYSLTEASLMQMEEVRIAVLEQAAVSNEELRKFCEANGIEASFVNCNTGAEQIAAIDEGKADAMNTTDANVAEDMRIVVRYSPKPFYFAAPKGQEELLGQLNAAMLNIETSDPLYEISLYEKYFNRSKQEFYLAEEEKEYISQVDALQVLLLDGLAPFQFTEKESGEVKGIAPDILKIVSEKTGLQFEYKVVATEEEMTAILAEEEVDIISGMFYDYGMADKYNIILTKSYAKVQAVQVLKKGTDVKESVEETCAIAFGTASSKEHEGQHEYYNSLAQCLEAVSREEVYCTYMNNYSAQYYSRMMDNQDLIFYPDTKHDFSLCMGVVKPADSRLFNIIDKVISTIPNEQYNNMMYENMLPETEKITFATYLKENPEQTLLLFGVIALIIMFFLLFCLYLMRSSQKRTALDNRRYEQISELSNEFIFEYDYQKDKLMLSEKAAAAFRTERMTDGYLAKLEKREDGSRVKELLEEVKRSKEGIITEREVLLNGDDKIWMRITSKALFDEGDHPICAIGKVIDIGEERKEKKRLTELAQRDGLTGIFNSATVRELIKGELNSESEAEGGALFVIDVDNFKIINDCYGHLVGDQVLIRLAEVLKITFRKGDIIGRLGGDEFTVFMGGKQKQETLADKCRFIQKAMTAVDTSNGTLNVTLSIGVVLTEKRGAYEQYYQQADEALYQVKKNGRDNFEIYE